MGEGLTPGFGQHPPPPPRSTSKASAWKASQQNLEGPTGQVPNGLFSKRAKIEGNPATKNHAPVGPSSPHPSWHHPPSPYLRSCYLALMPRRGGRKNLSPCTCGRRRKRQKLALAPCSKQPRFGPILPKSPGDHLHLEPKRAPSIHQHRTHHTQLWRGGWDRTPPTCTGPPACPHTKTWDHRK